jgi:hypothetical protein
VQDVVAERVRRAVANCGCTAFIFAIEA